MDKIAPVPKPAVSINAKSTTFLGFILGVEVVVLLKLVGTVRKFAISLIRAVSVLHIFSA